MQSGSNSKICQGTEEIEQQLKTLDTPTEDLGLFPSTHMVVHDSIFHVISYPLLALNMLDFFLDLLPDKQLIFQ